jgi:hypothetical protein
MESATDLRQTAAEHIRAALNASRADPELRRAFIRAIQAALADVNPMTVEEWEDAFARGTDPVAEIAYWLKIGRIYQRRVSRSDSMPLQDRKRCLHSILAALPSEESSWN